MGTLVPLTSEDWAHVRHDYECTNRKLFDICAEHGISERTLHDRVRRWGWKRRSAGPVPREGPPPMAPLRLMAPMMEAQPREMTAPPHLDPLPASGARESHSNAPSPHIREDGRERPVVLEDGRERPLVVVQDARPIGERLQGAIAQVMPALETTLSSLAAGAMQPRQMEQAARALGSLTRTLRELHGLVAAHGEQRDDTCDDVDALRENLSRQIDALIEEERQARPRRYLAAWEEFAAEAANAVHSLSEADGLPGQLSRPGRRSRTRLHGDDAR